jgi:hypothetical protein
MLSPCACSTLVGKRTREGRHDAALAELLHPWQCVVNQSDLQHDLISSCRAEGHHSCINLPSALPLLARPHPATNPNC